MKSGTQQSGECLPKRPRALRFRMKTPQAPYPQKAGTNPFGPQSEREKGLVLPQEVDEAKERRQQAPDGILRNVRRIQREAPAKREGTTKPRSGDSRGEREWSEDSGPSEGFSPTMPREDRPTQLTRALPPRKYFPSQGKRCRI